MKTHITIKKILGFYKNTKLINKNIKKSNKTRILAKFYKNKRNHEFTQKGKVLKR